MKLGISGTVSSSIVLPLLALSIACGGGATPKAETPAGETPAKEAAAEKETPAEPVKASEAAPPTPAKSLAKEVVLHEGTAFLLNHQKSDMGIAATAACEKQSNGDIAKKANCTSKAINKMKREGFMLEEDKGAGGADDDDGGDAASGGGGHWLFVRFNIDAKGVKVETNRVPVEVTKSSANSLTLKTTGPDKAKRKQGSVPSEMTFEVPDEYTVLTTEEGRGKMMFEPKLGLFAK
jgi:hypothetical protein